MHTKEVGKSIFKITEHEIAHLMKMESVGAEGNTHNCSNLWVFNTVQSSFGKVSQRNRRYLVIPINADAL